MAELTGITNLATLDQATLFASTRSQQFMEPAITLGYPTVYHQRGALLGLITATGIYMDYDTSAADGTENLAGILAVDLLSLGIEQPTNLIVDGDINRAACFSIETIPTGPTALLNNDSINFVNEN